MYYLAITVLYLCYQIRFQQRSAVGYAADRHDRLQRSNRDSLSDKNICWNSSKPLFGGFDKPRLLSRKLDLCFFTETELPEHSVCLMPRYSHRHNAHSNIAGIHQYVSKILESVRSFVDFAHGLVCKPHGASAVISTVLISSSCFDRY